MQVGDRILIDKEGSRKVYIVARVDVPHSQERAFASRSGGDFTIGIKFWKSDYVWSEKSRIWMRKSSPSRMDSDRATTQTPQRLSVPGTGSKRLKNSRK